VCRVDPKRTQASIGGVCVALLVIKDNSIVCRFIGKKELFLTECEEWSIVETGHFKGRCVGGDYEDLV
jgi:hypothetical protein